VGNARRSHATHHHLSGVAERAARAAEEPRQPLLPRGFLGWVAARALASVVLVGAAWVVYDCASSDRFQVRSVHVTGNLLLSQTDVEQIAGALGANIFWVDRREAEVRLSRLPMVRRAEVTAVLPDTVEIHVVERQPSAFWTSGDVTYLVDAEGVILKVVDGEGEQARYCSGQPCGPGVAALPTVAQVDGPPLTPGDQVDPGALGLSARLGVLLPQAGVRPVAFAWSRDAGLEVATDQGWRARFDTRADVQQQLSSLRAVREHAAKSAASVSLIDVRFGDRPYYR
jgi:hypothetical protein